jgi:hypothetical protein
LSKKPTCVNLDRNLVLIVQEYPLQINNISEILNHFLLALASEDEEMTPSQIKNRVWEIAQGMRKQIIEQQKLVKQDEPIPQQVNACVRCFDNETNSYALVSMTELKEWPDRYELDERIGETS